MMLVFKKKYMAVSLIAIRGHLKIFVRMIFFLNPKNEEIRMKSFVWCHILFKPTSQRLDEF